VRVKSLEVFRRGKVTLVGGRGFYHKQYDTLTDTARLGTRVRTKKKIDLHISSPSGTVKSISSSHREVESIPSHSRFGKFGGFGV
jgi:hypothetical protein